MKPSTILLLLALLGDATAINAQTREADTSKMMMDTSRAEAVPAPPRKAAHQAVRGPIEISAPQPTKDSLIKNIRAVFQRINHDSTLHAVTLDGETMEEVIGGSPDNGGDVTGYFKKDTIYKLVMSFGPSYGMKDWEYYYDRGQVIFVYEKDRHYPVAKDGGLNRDSIVTGFEGRFYFNKGKLFARIIKRNDQFMAEKIDDTYIRGLLLDSEEFVRALRIQMKKKK